MINNLTKECDFEIANLYYKKIDNMVVNRYCVFKDHTPNLLIFLVINNYISLTEIKNLMKNLLSLNFQ